MRSATSASSASPGTRSTARVWAGTVTMCTRSSPGRGSGRGGLLPGLADTRQETGAHRRALGPGVLPASPEYPMPDAETRTRGVL